MKKNNDQIEKIRHSLSHLMSMAVLEIYPNTGLGVGPVIENGFYQDYDLPESISDDLLPKLEKRIKHLIKQNIEFKKNTKSFEEALKFYKKDPYKKELIKDLRESGEKNVSFYKSDWYDNLCKGPHVKSTKEINPKAFKLTKIAGAYWRGDEKNKMLTRIYGVAFETEEELKEYEKMMAEAKKRDHKVLGKKLGLFIFSDVVGKGLPLFTEKGATIRRELENFIVKKELKKGYSHVSTPELAKIDLYKKSGHYPYYKDSMYPLMKGEDGDELMLRPMSCPHHFELYSSTRRSYKELPMRIAELARLYRYEQSGELAGLLRVRSFCLADAHIICMPSQAEEEIHTVLDLIEEVTKVLKLKKGEDYSYRLSLGNRKDDKKYFKDDKAWNFAEKVLRKALRDRKSPFVEAEDEAAFYGPKIDIQMKNVFGKEETAFTVQYDFVMPKRFDLNYIDKDGEEKEAIVIHRSSIGAIERVMALLIEKYAGDFPFWISPVQIQILPVSKKHKKYAQKLKKVFDQYDFRTKIDDDDESLGKRIRQAEMERIPFIIVAGDKEKELGTLAIRERGKRKIKEMEMDKFVEKCKKLLPKI